MGRSGPGGVLEPRDAVRFEHNKQPPVKTTSMLGRGLASKLVRLEGAEQTVRLIVKPCGEEQGVRAAGQTSIPERQSPQAVNRNRIAISVSELVAEDTTDRIKGIDPPVAEIADQHVMAERAEIGGSQGQAPGRVERPPRSEASDQGPIGVEDIDEPIARTAHVIVMGRVLQGKGDIELVINALDAERSETLSWYRTIVRQLQVGEGSDQVKLGIELLDRAEAEIGGEEEIA